MSRIASITVDAQHPRPRGQSLLRPRSARVRRPSTWVRRSNPPQALKCAVNEVDPECRDEDAKEQTKVGPLHLICEVGAHPGPGEHAARQDDGGVYVDVPVPVVLEGCGETNGRQEYREARAGGGVLREAGSVDEGGHDDDAATHAKQARSDTAENTNDQEDEPCRHADSPLE